MPIELDVKITANDMYRFNMYHIYTSFTGIFSILAAVLGFVAAVGTYGKVDTMYTVLYIIFGIVFLFLFSINLENAGGKTDFHVRGTEKYTALYVG